MCAIFGIVGKSDPNLLKKISISQLYRGPDSQEMYFDENNLFCLGNNRLAVIDKEGGNQDSSFWGKIFLRESELF